MNFVYKNFVLCLKLILKCKDYFIKETFKENSFFIVFRFGFKIDEQNGGKKNTQKKDQEDQLIMLIRNPAQESQSLRMSWKREKGTFRFGFYYYQYKKFYEIQKILLIFFSHKVCYHVLHYEKKYYVIK